MRKGRFLRWRLTCRPSQMRRRFMALLNATPKGRMQIKSSREQARMVRAAMPAAMASATKAASARAEGWLRRKAGVAGPLAGSQSMRNPPEMTERVRAQTRPI